MRAATGVAAPLTAPPTVPAAEHAVHLSNPRQMPLHLHHDLMIFCYVQLAIIVGRKCNHVAKKPKERPTGDAAPPNGPAYLSTAEHAVGHFTHVRQVQWPCPCPPALPATSCPA